MQIRRVLLTHALTKELNDTLFILFERLIYIQLKSVCRNVLFSNSTLFIKDLVSFGN